MTLLTICISCYCGKFVFVPLWALTVTVQHLDYSTTLIIHTAIIWIVGLFEYNLKCPNQIFTVNSPRLSGYLDYLYINSICNQGCTVVIWTKRRTLTRAPPHNHSLQFEVVGSIVVVGIKIATESINTCLHINHVLS